MVKQDEIFGTLQYECNWETIYTINIFNRKIDVILSVEGEEDEEIEEGQKNSFIDFEKNIDAIIIDVEYKLFEYYKKNYMEFKEGIDEEFWEQKVPDIKEKEELGNYVKPYMIRFPYTFDRNVKVYGIIFDCPWEDEAGIAVKFKNGQIEVGFDDIIL